MSKKSRNKRGRGYQGGNPMERMAKDLWDDMIERTVDQADRVHRGVWSSWHVVPSGYVLQFHYEPGDLMAEVKAGGRGVDFDQVFLGRFEAVLETLCEQEGCREHGFLAVASPGIASLSGLN